MEGYVSISVRKADKRKKEKGTDRRSILFLLFAVYGLLFLVGSVEGVDVDLPVFFLSAVPCLLLWSSVVLSLFLFFMECIVRLHWPLYLLGTACFIAAPFLGISLSLPAVFCLVGFQILFWHVHIIERYGKKKLFLSSDKRSLRSSVWMLAWLSLLFTVAVLLVNLSPRRFYDAAFAVEGLVQRTLLRADDRLIDPVSGTVSRGNLYPADVPQLVVTSTKQPTQILYLKGFSGDDYHNGQWQEADNMMEVVYRAAYGSDDGSRDKDYETVKSVYDKVAVQVYQNQTACKKFLFRCLKMYFV